MKGSELPGLGDWPANVRRCLLASPLLRKLDPSGVVAVTSGSGNPRTES